MDEENQLPLKPSKDEVDVYGKTAQSKELKPPTDEISGKLYHLSHLSSAPIHINVPINPSLETIGALCELETVEINSSRGSSDSDDCDRPPDNYPQSLEDLIQLEHNYAAIFINALERNENEESAMDHENKSAFSPKNKSETSSENKTSSSENLSMHGSENKSEHGIENRNTSGLANKSAPSLENPTALVKVVPQFVKKSILMPDLTTLKCYVRRSKRQIEKQERELVEKEVEDVFQDEAKGDLTEIRDKNNSLVLACDLSSEIENPESKSYCSNYKCFAEFKKRQLKIIIEDCRFSQNLEYKGSSNVASNAVKETVCNSLDTENKDATIVDKEECLSENLESPLKKRIPIKTKLPKSKAIEKIDTNIPLLRKRKILKSDPKKDHIRSLKSDKDANMEYVKTSPPKHKLPQKSNECEQKQNEMEVSSKKQKHSSNSDNSDLFDDSKKIVVVNSNKRKKTVSFSDDVIVHDKPEIPEKKQSLIDCKVSPLKSISPILSPTAKSQKKKAARRESIRLVVNEDEPPLFSQPDIMIKVKSDDTIKKEEKEGDQSLSNQDLDMKVEICSNILELSNSTNKPTNESTVDETTEKEKINDPVNQCEWTPNTSQTIEVEETNAEQSDSANKHLINPETLREDENKVILNDLNPENEASNNKSSDDLNILNIADNKKLEITSKQDSVDDDNNENLINNNKNVIDNNENLIDNKTLINKNETLIDNNGTSIDNNKNLTDMITEKPPTVVMNIEKLAPERKSRRIIKKKEFFEDFLDITESKKSHKQQDMKPSAEKKTANDKTLVTRSANSNMNNEEKRISENSNSDIDDSMDSDESEEDDPNKLWCICRKPHNARFMIQCDKCEDWFHGSCVGVTKLFGRQLEKLKKEWWCPNCRVQGQSVPQKVDKILGDTIIESKVEKIPLGKDKVKKFDSHHALNRANKPSSDTSLKESIIKPQENAAKPIGVTTKPNESTTKTKVSATKTKESNIKEPILKQKDALKNINLRKERKISHAISIDDGKCTKVLSSSSGAEKINKNPNLKFLKMSNLTSQKQPESLEAKSPITIKKKSVTMLSNTDVQQTLLSQKQLLSPIQTVPLGKHLAQKSTQRSIVKQTHVLPSNKKILYPPKEKGVVKKKQTCVQCQTEAKVNSCYCSDSCIDKHVAQCLKSMRETKGTPKGGDFDSQRLVVFDRLKGSVITNGPTSKEIFSWLKANPSYMIVFTPSTKKETISQKKECDSSTETEKKEVTDEAAKATVRLNVRKTLKNILMDRCKNADDIQLLEVDVQRIANKIEEELHSLFKDNSFKYRAKYRSLMFNIKDPRNQGLFRKILKGNIPPDRLVRMSSEELASIELAKWREQENQHLLDLIKREQLEHQKTNSGLLLKKTHKGEVEIEDDLTSVIEQDVPKAIPKDTSEELIESEKEEIKNTTHLHRSHLFDLNCKICTGKIVPPPVDESIPKKVRVAHSISVDNQSPTDSVERSVSRIVEGKSPVSSTGEDSMDQVPTSTVSIGSPEMNIKPSSKNYPSKAVTSVWKGFIFMQDIAKFVTSAYKVSGQTNQLRSDLPDTIQVCGRIIPDQVWDYLGKIKQSGNKELIIIHFQPANDEEAVAYHSFYSYLSSRKRYGVVSNYSKKIKDFYLLPLSSASPVPMVLVPFDGPGLPSPRPHLLLGVIVRHKLKQVSATAAPKQIPVSKVSKVEVVKTSRSYTPPPEPRSYTPPLPTSHSSDESSKHESEVEVIYSPVDDFKSIAKLDKSHSIDLKFVKKLTQNKVSECPSSSPVGKQLVSDTFSSVKDEDKPYDPEQDVFSLTSEKKSSKTIHTTNKKPGKGSDNLEQHKKILDALTRQVEETDRQVNALKQLISVPEDEVGVQSPNTLIDINSVAEAGMSSFLDLPDNLQEILNTVRLKSCDKVKNIHEKGDVDMRIKDLFGKQFDAQTSDEVPLSAYKVGTISKPAEASTISSKDEYSSQAETPPPTEEKDKPANSGPSDPRIKLRTSFHAQSFKSKDAQKSSLSGMSASELILHAQKQFVNEKSSDLIPPFKQETKKFRTIANELPSSYSSNKEPPPPGVEAADLTLSQERINSIQINTSVPYASTSLVPDSSQQVNAALFLQQTSSFPVHLPHGFSVHTPPPNIQHFPSLITPTSFPPPPLPVPPPTGSESNMEDSWSAMHSSFQSEADKWENPSNWDGQDQVTQHHSSERSNEYHTHSERFHKKGFPNRHWGKQQSYAKSLWKPQNVRGSRFHRGSRRRGGRSTFKRNQRN